MIGSEIEQFISLLAKLPGLGQRSAKRLALHLIKKRDTQMLPLIRSMQEVIENVKVCPVCGNLDTSEPCYICRDAKRDKSSICVIADIADLWALERSGTYRGHYQILGGLLSALDGVAPDDLNIASLVSRVENDKVAEVILALPVTVEGQTTSHYIADILRETGAKVYALAQGIPVGGELDYLDDGTIAAAFRAKNTL